MGNTVNSCRHISLVKMICANDFRPQYLTKSVLIWGNASSSGFRPQYLTKSVLIWGNASSSGFRPQYLT